MSDASFEYEFPYSSQRLPVLARNAVATSQPLAAQAGLEMLRRGGNAADAAVATVIALTVVEPTSNGIGSDAFALIWSRGGLHGLNASGRAPRGLDRSAYDGLASIPFAGWEGVTTPGAVSGWVAVSERFGALPIERLFEPAIHYAREGFLVSPQTAFYWARGAAAYDRERFREWHETFAPNGATPKAGELFRSEAHARTLEQIAATRGESFYRGELAEQIARAARAGGGAVAEHDLAEHEPEWVRPISIEYSGFTLHEIPPSGQGLAALIALGILRHFDMRSALVDSPEALHVQIEAMKLAFADAHRHIADPGWMTMPVESLLDDQYLASRAKLIDRKQAHDHGHGEPKSGGTVYLAAADANGDMVSFIQSNYTGFGSGIVIPGTGIALQNRGCCFSLERGHPNEIGPGKRPYHTIIPGFVTKRSPAVAGETPVMSFGVMGGFMQPQGHAQVMIRIADWRQNPQAALDAPRWRVDGGFKVEIEPGFDPAVYRGLSSLGHEVTLAAGKSVAHGRGQIIWKLDHGYLAASDPRSDGQAVGF